MKLFIVTHYRLGAAKQNRSVEKKWRRNTREAVEKS